MECAINTDPFRLRTFVEASPGEYDAHPILKKVRVSGLPIVMSPDRTAVAAVLCFANFIGGSFTTDQGCSPQVGNAINRWFSPADMHVLNINFEPAARADGDATIHVVAEGINDSPEVCINTAGNDVVFSIFNEGTGSIATATSLGVASNVWLLADASGSMVERILPAIGIAVLFAEDLFASAISIPGADSGLEGALLEKLHGLLDATGLGLAPPECPR